MRYADGLIEITRESNHTHLLTMGERETYVGTQELVYVERLLTNTKARDAESVFAFIKNNRGRGRYLVIDSPIPLT